MIKINNLFSIEKFLNKDFFLPNSVAVMENGDVLICDGGNDRICLFNSNAEPIKEIGKKGWGRYRFKEPVGAFVSPNNSIFVMDWHNHRVVVFDSNLIFQNEFGHYSNFDNSNDNSFLNLLLEEIKNFFKILKNIPKNGVYINFHFKENTNISNKYLSFFQVLISYTGFIFSFFNKCINKSFLGMGFNKPNGIAFANQKIVITQKKNNCISVHSSDFPYNKIFSIKKVNNNSNLGNLGNIIFKKKYYVCDESEGLIWILDSEFTYVDKIDATSIDVDNFAPFSCTFLNDNLIAIVSCFKFFIYDMKKKQNIYESFELGELHGIDFDCKNSRLYVCNRSKCKIHVFDVELLYN